MLESFIEFLKNKDVEYEENAELSKLCYMKVGGPARIAVSPKNIKSFIETIDFLTQASIKFTVVGRVSNTLPSDSVFDGVVVKTTKMREKNRAENVFSAECGVTLAELFSYGATFCMGGGEELFMIPGTVGGALRGNAGAYGKSIGDLVVDARVYDAVSRSVLSLSCEELNFSYRDSRIKKEGLYLLDARFRLEPRSIEAIRERTRELSIKRRESQPLEYPSLGSIFKKCGDTSAAYYIFRAGLSGLRIGGAAVSEKHSGFIVNLGGASAFDVKELIRIVKDRVYTEFGVLLEEEIEII